MAESIVVEQIELLCMRQCLLEGLATPINVSALSLDLVQDCATGCPPESAIMFTDVLSSLVLLILSGLFSGLTLGLMSLDQSGLEILIAGGEEDEKRFASMILPVRARGNLLLCTLLLGNTAVNALMAITLAGMAGGLLGSVLATGTIVIFGEIIPQSVCSRYGLMIGAYTLPIVKLFILLMYPVAKPISVVLDVVLGREMGAVYNRKELIHLLEMQADNIGDTDVTRQDAKIMTGALQLSERKVENIMTKIDDVFMIDNKAKLDFQTLLKIYQSGYTRIPVYEEHRNRVVGLLLSKDLILVDPDDEIAVSSLMTFCGRELKTVWYDMKVNEMLQVFKSLRTHISLVQIVNDQTDGDPFYEQVGVVTLEDVLEELIQDEIVDESDVVVDNLTKEPVAQASSDQTNLRMEFISMLEHKKSFQDCLNPSELNAVVAFLNSNIDGFRAHKASSIKKLVSRCQVVNLKKDSPPLYEKGQPTTNFSLILQGRLSVTSGNEGFVTECGPWTALASRAVLATEPYPVDFTTGILENCRILMVNQTIFTRWMNQSTTEVDDSSNTQTSNKGNTGAKGDSASAFGNTASQSPPTGLFSMSPKFGSMTSIFDRKGSQEGNSNLTVTAAKIETRIGQMPKQPHSPLTVVPNPEPSIHEDSKSSSRNSKSKMSARRESKLSSTSGRESETNVTSRLQA